MILAAENRRGRGWENGPNERRGLEQRLGEGGMRGRDGEEKISLEAESKTSVSKEPE